MNYAQKELAKLATNGKTIFNFQDNHHIDPGWEDDTRYNHMTLKTVRRYEKNGGGWEVSFEEGFVFGVPGWSPVEPKPGMVMRQYTNGMFCYIRGIMLDGTIIYYSNDAFQKIRDTRDTQIKDSLKILQAAQEYEEVQRQILALPSVFRDKFHNLNANNPTFWYNFEGYELAACQAALAVIEACTSLEDVQKLHKMPYEEQEKKLPAWKEIGLSGNQADFAFYIAQLWFTDILSIATAHGALATLVGCEEYGCHPPTIG